MRRGRVPTAHEVIERLEEFRRRRGYLMAHQGVMAAALPRLQDGYGVIYKALTLDRNHLGDLEKEFVWLVLLVAAGEHIGTHHVDLFYKAGATERQAEAAFRLVAWSAGAGTFEFLDRHWQGHFPGVDARTAYLSGVDELVTSLGCIPMTLARLALVAAHTARRARWAIGVELEACYAARVPEVQMAEAMSLAMWPCGVNCFLEASDAWLDLIRSGRVQASDPFRAWASMPGQEGFVLPPRGGSRHTHR